MLMRSYYMIERKKLFFKLLHCSLDCNAGGFYSLHLTVRLITVRTRLFSYRLINRSHISNSIEAEQKTVNDLEQKMT